LRFFAPWREMPSRSGVFPHPMPISRQDIAARFSARFGEPPRWIVRAPGRVNLLGEHTDYNDGFVLPMAVDRGVWIAMRPRADRQVVIHSLDYDQTSQFALDALAKGDGGWIEYVKGTAWSLQEAGHRLVGWEGVLAGDVPRGAGLSSSAALELAVARAMSAVSGFDWNPIVMAQLSQRAENHWVGVGCGIMDPLISAAGREGHALLIDCRSLSVQPVPLPHGVSVVVLDTATRRGLVDSAYNERRAQCELAARFFGQTALRDVTLEQLDHAAGQLDPVVLRRARHVISENARTRHAAEAMQRGDADSLGRLMAESHVSLRDDFEVSSEALNAMVGAAAADPDCCGARMTGAGFGGCAVALVRAESADAFAIRVAQAYRKATDLAPSIYVCQAANGAEIVA